VPPPVLPVPPLSPPISEPVGPLPAIAAAPPPEVPAPELLAGGVEPHAIALMPVTTPSKVERMCEGGLVGICPRRLRRRGASWQPRDPIGCHFFVRAQHDWNRFQGLQSVPWHQRRANSAVFQRLAPRSHLTDEMATKYRGSHRVHRRFPAENLTPRPIGVGGLERQGGL
jgi:hypothetical protein